ncbi:MAG TPA: hypothetical protein IAC53_07540 [Candidatus Fimenecus excrementigallinarum]|uniref:Bypass of forespore C C-terminal domain-containing protein n=1 Tax=Candidatus Fimenecus excrementigallinarum TaxID=2840816 RepID=A0A9D1IG76_9FIRM|nr:hypothetical protein [Candidatus Fimenecus excrementigallinarum]
MQKILKHAILAVVCAIVLVVCGAAFALRAGDGTAPLATEVQKAAAPKYIFSQFEGRLALYERGSTMPTEIYDVYLRTLPQSEQERVTAGIPAETDEEILKIIEAYTS